MSSDDRLARHAAQGDERAFAEIYRRYSQDLYRFCLAMVGNPQDAQDTLQNTMVKVLRGLRGERREIKLKPWLYRIARNESVETLRKRRESAELEPRLAGPGGVSETAEARERLRTLLADLNELPERQRAALIMRELAGLDFDQIASAFGSSAAVARQTLYEARLSLRQLEAGREMRCEEVMRELSDADGRVTRRREIRAHLRSCADCRVFREEISRRHEDLASLAPLGPAAAAGLLHGVLDTGASAAAGAASGSGALGGSIGVAGKTIAASTLVKSAATVAVVAVVGVSAAQRGGVIDLPLPGRDRDEAPASTIGAPDRGDTGEDGSAPAAAAAPSEDANGRPASLAAGAEERDAQAESGSQKNDGHSDGAAATEGSPLQAGETPPGGGYGRSASEQKGRPDQLPAASEKGQQTAAARKPDHAGSPASSGAGGQSTDGPPASKPPQAKDPATAPAPESPPPTANEKAGGPPGSPPGHGTDSQP